jgi:hypothetical protein
MVQKSDPKKIMLSLSLVVLSLFFGGCSLWKSDKENSCGLTCAKEEKKPTFKSSDEYNSLSGSSVFSDDSDKESTPEFDASDAVLDDSLLSKDSTQEKKKSIHKSTLSETFRKDSDALDAFVVSAADTVDDYLLSEGDTDFSLVVEVSYYKPEVDEAIRKELATEAAHMLAEMIREKMLFSDILVSSLGLSSLPLGVIAVDSNDPCYVIELFLIKT